MWKHQQGMNILGSLFNRAVVLHIFYYLGLVSVFWMFSHRLGSTITVLPITSFPSSHWLLTKQNKEAALLRVNSLSSLCHTISQVHVMPILHCVAVMSQPSILILDIYSYRRLCVKILSQLVSTESLRIQGSSKLKIKIPANLLLPTDCGDSIQVHLDF